MFAKSILNVLNCVVVFALLALSTPAHADPTGDTFSFGFSGWTNTDAGGWVFNDGVTGTTGGNMSFIFGTPGNFDLLGNTLVLDTSVISTGPTTEDWVFSISAAGGGTLYDDTIDPDNNFWAFRELSVGVDVNDPFLFVDGLVSPTQSDLPHDYAEIVGAIEVFDAADSELTTRNMWSMIVGPDNALDIGFGNTPDSEIVLKSFDNSGGDFLTTATELRITYSVNVVPEPTSIALIGCVTLGLLMSRRRGRK